MAWFWRGAQSAFFYYISCAPCTNAAFNRKRAKEAARAERDACRMIEQGIGQQQSTTGRGAFTTNIYWREEMMLGPHPKKGGPPKSMQQHVEKTAAGGNKEDAGDNRVNKKGKKRKRGQNVAVGEEERAGTAESADANLPLRAASGNEPRPTPGNANAIATNSSRYQRPDEALWGDPFPPKDWAYYARGRNPELGPRCPPIVSTPPASAAEAAWMLQPPPPARVMEGKQPPATGPMMRYPGSGVGTSADARKGVGSGKKDKEQERRLLAGFSKRSGGTKVGELPARGRKVVLCDLGERMSEYNLPARGAMPKKKRVAMPRVGRLDGMNEDDEDEAGSDAITATEDEYEESSGLEHEDAEEGDEDGRDAESSQAYSPRTPYTPGTSLESNRLDGHDDSAISVDISSPSKSLSRGRRPPPILTSPVKAAKPAAGGKPDGHGFDTSWTFPMRRPQADQASV